jgi:hypothetical protein
MEPLTQLIKFEVTELVTGLFRKALLLLLCSQLAAVVVVVEVHGQAAVVAVA